MQIPSSISLSTHKPTDPIIQTNVQPKDFLQHKKEETRAKPNLPSRNSTINKVFQSKNHGHRINDSIQTSFSVDLNKNTRTQSTAQLTTKGTTTGKLIIIHKLIMLFSL